MTADVPQSGCPIVARGLGAGALWGGVIGVTVLFAMAVLSGAMATMLYVPFAVLVGAVVGGLFGLLSGIALALYEQPGGRSDGGGRRTAVMVNGVAWTVIGIVVHAGTVEAVAFLLTLAATGATAGALLAPCVVQGRRGTPSLHE